MSKRLIVAATTHELQKDALGSVDSTTSIRVKHDRHTQDPRVSFRRSVLSFSYSGKLRNHSKMTEAAS